MDRRTFLQKGIAALGAGLLARPALAVEKGGTMAGTEVRAVTVAGPIAPEALGVTLPHEHVLVDFIGADRASRDRYDPAAVAEAVLPHLKQAKALGCQTLAECTPAYIGRDPALLVRLSAESGLTVLTNTGYYGAANDKFVPAHAYRETADELAGRWVREWEEGIEGTGVRPGFIKIGVDGAPLSEIDRKLVQAAARAHLKTGLTIASHTGPAGPAREQLEILKAEGVAGSAWIWVHAQGEADNGAHAQAADEGAWLSFDGIGPKSLEKHTAHVVEMKRRGLLRRVLISHDAGWYRPGEPGGGAFRPFDTLFVEFLPALQAAGFTAEEIRLLTVENPAWALAVRVRAR